MESNVFADMMCAVPGVKRCTGAAPRGLAERILEFCVATPAAHAVYPQFDHLLATLRGAVGIDLDDEVMATAVTRINLLLPMHMKKQYGPPPISPMGHCLLNMRQTATLAAVFNAHTTNSYRPWMHMCAAYSDTPHYTFWNRALPITLISPVDTDQAVTTTDHYLWNMPVLELLLMLSTTWSCGDITLEDTSDPSVYMNAFDYVANAIVNNKVTFMCVTQE